MKRFLVGLFVLLFAAPLAAQELPFAVQCLADEGKTREVEFCGALVAELDAHPQIRQATESDSIFVVAVVIPYEKAGIGDGILPVGVTVGIFSSALDGMILYVTSGIDIGFDGEFQHTAKSMVTFILVRAAQWMQSVAEKTPQPAPAEPSGEITLEASPP